MQYLPVLLDVDHRSVMVVGGSEKAAQKLRLLTRTSACISVVAEQVTGEIAALVNSGAVKHVARAFRPADVAGQTVVFAANDDAARDGAVAAAGNAAGVLVNVVCGPARLAKLDVDGVPSEVVVKGGADVPAALSQPAKVWTPQEVALATFWVAG